MDSFSVRERLHTPSYQQQNTNFDYFIKNCPDYYLIQLRRQQMSNIDIVRAWKDEDYRASLSEAEQAMLPENPAGLVDLADEDMSSMAGGLALEHEHTDTCRHCCGAALASDVSPA